MPDTWRTHCLEQATVKNERLLERPPWHFGPQCCHFGLPVVEEPARTAETQEELSWHQVSVALVPPELGQPADESGELLHRSRPALAGPAAVRLVEAARLPPTCQGCWAQESMAQPCAVAARGMSLQPNLNLSSHCMLQRLPDCFAKCSQILGLSADPLHLQANLNLSSHAHASACENPLQVAVKTLVDQQIHCS